jgi:hypothetical protein
LLTSAHFRYHARSGQALCPDLMERLEANLAAVAGVLGIDPDRVQVEYYKYLDAEDVRVNGPCPNGLRACAGGATIHTSDLQAHQHELVHAYVAHVGRPSNVYQEGLAEMFNCDAMAGPDPPVVSWRDVADVAGREAGAEPAPGEISATAYYSASMFLVRRTIDRFGASAFMNFYATGSTNRASTEQFGDEYQAAFGEPLDAAWADLQSPARDFGWPFLCPCGAPTAIGETVTFDETCPTGLPSVATYTLAAPKPLALTVDGAGANVIVRACDGVAPSPAQWHATDDYFLPEDRSGGAVLTELGSGTFYVGALAGAGRFTLSDTTWLAPTCEAAPALRLGRDIPRDYKLWASIPHDARRWLRLVTDEPLKQAPPGMLAYCDACPSSTVTPSCTSPQSTSDVIPAGSYLLSIEPSPGPRFTTVWAQYDPPM